MSRIALDLGIIQIYWYSLFILLAFFVGSTLVFIEAKKHRINEEFLTNLIFWALIFGLVGARVYYVAFNWDSYSSNLLEIFEVWNGGLAIHGGILAAVIWIIIYCKKYGVQFLKIFDISVVGLIIGQAIGRWGNFFNKEAYGAKVLRSELESMNLPEFIIEGMNINGAYYQPTFLYESVWNIVGFLILLLLRKFKYIKTGQLTAFYMMWYSFGRFFIESLRSDSLMLGSLKIAQVVSVVLFIIGLVMMIVVRRGSKFERLYRNIDNEEIIF